MRLKLIFILLSLAFSCFCIRGESVSATKCLSKILIDGNLNESCWVNAPSISSFTQVYPNPKSEPTFKTEVKILYDEKNLYFGVVCFDDEPLKIYKKILRRDRDELNDTVVIQLDPDVTKREAYSFSISASSSIADFFVYNEFSENVEWNGIWEAKSKVTEYGWQCEVEIPFSTLRIFKSNSLDIGLQVLRKVGRLKELDALFYISPDERKNVSGFGVIKNIEGIKCGGRGDFYPFFLLKDRFHTRRSFYKRGASFDIGLDFNFPLSSRFFLTGTINPDFGQVEQDSAVLNLSSYETFFPENRPFFLEGFQAFNPPRTSFSGTTFLYTRRIGSTPYEPVSYEGHRTVYAPEKTRILYALKLTGTTENRFNIAGFVAVTETVRSDYADKSGNINEEILKKETFFSALRLNYNFGTNSSIGFLQTYKDEIGGRKAILNAITGDFHSSENTHNFSFNVARTQLDNLDEEVNGTSFEGVVTEKLSKNWTFSLSCIAHPKDYNPNDLGYLRRNDEYKVVSSIEMELVEPNEVFNQMYLSVSNWYGKNGKGLILTRGGEVDLWGEFLNHNAIWSGFSVEFPYFDDREPRIEGRSIYREEENYFWVGFSTDTRKPIYFKESITLKNQQKGKGYSNNFSLNVRFSDRCNLSEALNFSSDKGLFLFAGVKDEKIPIFAKVNSRFISLTTRFSYTFSPTLTFDLYSQLFSASARYSDYKKVLTPTIFIDAKNFATPNFKIGTNNLTAVLRWEFKPSSVLYIVFSHGQQGRNDFDLYENVDGMSLKRELTFLTSLPRDDLFLLKISYRF